MVPSAEHVTLTTADGITLSALSWQQSSPTTIVLLHMMPAAKESWLPLVGELLKLPVNIITPDFRGHGQSGGGNYVDFTNEQHQSYMLDVNAVVAYATAQGSEKFLFAGASIGANCVVKYMAEHPAVERGVLLSAGLDYYGVKAEDDIARLTENQSLLIAASEDDTRRSGSNCAAMAKELAERTTAPTELLVYETGGHGTDMFAAHPELITTISDFLRLGL